VKSLGGEARALGEEPVHHQRARRGEHDGVAVRARRATASASIAPAPSASRPRPAAERAVRPPPGARCPRPGHGHDGADRSGGYGCEVPEGRTAHTGSGFSPSTPPLRPNRATFARLNTDGCGREFLGVCCRRVQRPGRRRSPRRGMQDRGDLAVEPRDLGRARGHHHSVPGVASNPAGRLSTVGRSGDASASGSSREARSLPSLRAAARAAWRT
jgi:hypothetical protein